MKKITLLAITGMIAACATVPVVQAPAPYTPNFTTVVNEGKIDAHEVINMQNKTTFKATEYTNCSDEKDLLTIVWEGEFTTAKINLVKQIATNYFNHFYPRATINYVEVNAISARDANTVVIEFTRAVRAF